ncbi:MAG: DUF547 domain-containing protein [Myxococcales bacterium]|nr:DUF547 domain-containing protein [Deltaproteobacteria bacterium]NNE19176.1 DUF547 domain-containing protein [Myxococcales bacterium]
MNAKSKPWYGRWWSIALLIALVIAATGILTVKALGMRSIDADAEPFAQTAGGFDYSWWNAALGRWVRPGGVDYEAVRADEEELRRFIATLGTIGPRVTPERFSTDPERLSYYINAYNALVLFAVVDNWPIDTVHDVHGWLDPRAGFGFFYGLRFPLDGAEINLYDLENEVIRGFIDARIHAAINCASKSCPALMPFAFEPARLDEQLDAVTRAFCSNPVHVRVDDEAKEIQLSAIFDWYKPDFEEHARRLDRPATIEGFVLAFAAPEVAAELERALGAEFDVVFRPYDWALNRL